MKYSKSGKIPKNGIIVETYKNGQVMTIFGKNGKVSTYNIKK